MTMRSKAWWAILGCSSVGWWTACAPIVTVADGGDAGSAGEDGGESASAGTGGTWGGGATGGTGSGVAGGGFAGSGIAGGGFAGTSGSGQTAGAAGSTLRDATEEEDSIPEGCTFTFGPADPGGDSSDAPADPPECGCTRRPGDGTSFLCPWGEGVTVSAPIGPEGGTLVLRDTESTRDAALELRIPRNALAETVTISITELTVAPPDDLNDWSPLYRFEPADLEFLRPVELILPWSGLGGFVTDLTLYFSSEAGGSCDMTALGDNYVNTGFNQGSLNHLGWAIVGRPKQDGCP